VGRERDRQRERVGVIVVAASGMIHKSLTTSTGSSLQEFQLAGKLGMVQQLDPSLSKERLAFQVGEALVEVALGARLLGDRQLGVDVADALCLEALTDPAGGVPVPSNGGDAVALAETGDLPHDTFQVDGLARASTPPTHDILNNPPIRAVAIAMNDGEGEGIGCAT
jgi:hypothetical protein